MTTSNPVDQKVIAATYNFPLLDLHCHLRGTLLPNLAKALADNHKIKLPKFTRDLAYAFSDFDDFLFIYDKIGQVIRTPDDMNLVAVDYLRRSAQCGAKYVELMISPGHSMLNGIPFASQISAISDAIDQAREDFGIYSSIIVTCVRHRGPEEALQIAELIGISQNSHIRGFGLTGNERLFEIEDFEGAFLVAKECGLGLTAHAGEWLPGESVLRAVNALRLDRVGHGITAAQCPNVLDELSDMGIGFEICLSSNFKLGACPSNEIHPARAILDAGCKVTFSTDDPAYFRTDPRNEMEIATRILGLSSQEIAKVFEDSVAMSFCLDDIKNLIKKQSEAQQSSRLIAL